MASTSDSNPSCEIDVEEDEYPCPSHNLANINIVTIKLGANKDVDVYNVWKKQMLCLLASHDMLGFIDGRFLRPFGKAKDGNMKAWIKLDSLVTGWILGSLSEKAAIRVVKLLTSRHKSADFSAKDAWDELKHIYGPSDPQQTKESVDEGCIVHEVLSRYQCLLYDYVVRGKTEKIDDLFNLLNLTPTDRITNDGNTSLHVAVQHRSQEFLEKLLKRIPEENNEQLIVKNSLGSTPLHVAVTVGNTKAADILVQRNADLLFVEDNKGRTPLDISLYHMHINTSQCLLEHIINYKGKHTMFSGKRGAEHLVLAISHKKFDLSLKLVRHHKTIHNSEAVLMAIAENFPCKLRFWERRAQDIDYHAWVDKHRRLIRSCGPSVAVIWKFLIFGISKIYMISVIIIKKIVSLFLKERLRNDHKDATDLLWAVFDKIPKNIHSSPFYYYTNLIFGATRLNAYEVVTLIVSHHPDIIWIVNDDGHNLIQYAVINRSEKIYNLLTELISKNKYIYQTIKDPYGNNLLHLAGRLAPANKLNLISGAALQIQRELQWFKDVEEFVGPITRTQKNYADETPEMVFTREHMDLVIDGEKWMKATAESYTITAALIVTIVFAAAITVPGGNNEDTGIPVHNNNIAFKMFAVSDAISLFAAVTSLLMFLSILTTRFSEKDFLFKLPRRLIFGLSALFISTTAMIIAFGATLFLVFGHDNSWILIPIGVLTCLPITTFVTLQFPLIADLTRATYGRIFVKRKPDEYFVTTESHRPNDKEPTADKNKSRPNASKPLWFKEYVTR